MTEQVAHLNSLQSVSEIVAADYRTAEVFRRNGIGFCCGGNWPLKTACELKGIQAEDLIGELAAATKTMRLPGQLDFASWNPNFLIDYIIHIYHSYIKMVFPQTSEVLHEFTEKHVKKYPYLKELENEFNILGNKILELIRQEEEVIFPYTRQLVSAHKHKETYAALFIRTLRKPIEDTILKQHQVIEQVIFRIRQLAVQYNSPENACLSHKVVLARLKEFDEELIQFMYIVQKFLCPVILEMEQELLKHE